MTDPLRPRDEAAVRAFRETGERRHIDVLDMDGLPQLCHDLLMERAYPRPSEYSVRIDAWLAGGTGGAL